MFLKQAYFKNFLLKSTLIIPTLKDYLCEISDNVYEIDFVKFKIRDMDSNRTLYEVCKPDENSKIDLSQLSDECRFIRYNFASSFLKLKNVGAMVEFTVGDKPVQKFSMIERHYFRNRLIKSFDFDFGFCLPNSRNTIEHIYDMPELSRSDGKVHVFFF